MKISNMNYSLLSMCFIITSIEIEARGRRQSWDGEALQHANEPSFGNRGRNGNSRLGNQFSESDSAKRRGSNSSVDSRWEIEKPQKVLILFKSNY